MQLLNALSVPRGDARYARRVIPANCLVTDVAGDCVYISGEMVAGRYQVSRADPTNPNKMPALGVIVGKTAPTVCTVQTLGPLSSAYSGLIPGKELYVDLDGRPTHIPPAVAQGIGVALSSTDVLIIPSFTSGSTGGSRSGNLITGNFSGNPKKATVTLAIPYPDTTYGIFAMVQTNGGRTYSPAIESQTINGFVVNLHSNNLAGMIEVAWFTILAGE